MRQWLLLRFSRAMFRRHLLLLLLLRSLVAGVATHADERDPVPNVLQVGDDCARDKDRPDNEEDIRLICN